MFLTVRHIMNAIHRSLVNRSAQIPTAFFPFRGRRYRNLKNWIIPCSLAFCALFSVRGGREITYICICVDVLGDSPVVEILLN